MKRLRNYFKTVTSGLRADGTIGGTRFLKGDKPTEDVFKDLRESHPMFLESADRAKVSTGGGLGEEVGLVTLSTDVQAKANATQLTDRSLVVQPHQLPTVESTTNDFILTTIAADGINSATQDPFDIVVDTLTTTRNKFTVKFKVTFVKWLLRRVVPAGGTIGQALVKLSGVDYDYGWGTVAAGSTGGDTYKTTSSSAILIGLGTKTFTVPVGLAYSKGVRARATNTADNTQFIEGIVSSYSSTSLVLTSDVISGTGTPTSWTINIGGDIPQQLVSGVRNLYVSDLGGNDSFDGSITKPFKKIDKAISVVADNQTIVIFAGSYNNTVNVVKNAGITYTLYCFPGVVVNQVGAPFYDSQNATSRVDIYGEPDIIQGDSNMAFVVMQIAKLYIGKISSVGQGMLVYSTGNDMGLTNTSSRNTIISVREASYTTVSAPFVRFASPGGLVSNPNGTIIASFGSLEYEPLTSAGVITGANYIEIDNPYTLSIINSFLQWRGPGTASNFVMIKFIGTPVEVSIDNMSVRVGGTAGSTFSRVLDFGAIAVGKTLFRNIYVSVKPVTTFINGTATQSLNVENVLLPVGSGLITGTAVINAVAPAITNTRVYVSTVNSIASIATRI